MRRLLYFLTFLYFLSSPSARAQSIVRYDNVLLSSRGLPLAGATIAVCTQPANTATTPCTPLATVYSDNAGANALNPLTTDGLGNYHFYIAAATCGVGSAGCTIQWYGGGAVTGFKADQSFVGTALIPGCTATNGVAYETAANTLGCGSALTWDPVNQILTAISTGKGISTPAITFTGPTAGFMDYQQGSTSAAVTQCAAANSICDQAPTAVTSYLNTKPGVAPVIASYDQTDGCPAAVCTHSFHPAPLVLTVNSDFVTANNANLQAITGLAFTNPANKALKSKWDCDVQYNQQTAAVADAFGIQDVSVAPNEIDGSGYVQTAATTWVDSLLSVLTTTTATNIAVMTPSATATVWHAQLHALVDHPSNAATSVIQMMVSTSNGADTVTVKRGSACLVSFQ